MKSCLSNQFSHIRKSEMLTVVDSVATLGSEIDAVSINPGHSSGHHTKVEMIDDGMGFPVLSLGATELVFCKTNNWGSGGIELKPNFPHQISAKVFQLIDML